MCHWLILRSFSLGIMKLQICMQFFLETCSVRRRQLISLTWLAHGCSWPLQVQHRMRSIDRFPGKQTSTQRLTDKKCLGDQHLWKGRNSRSRSIRTKAPHGPLESSEAGLPSELMRAGVKALELICAPCCSVIGWALPLKKVVTSSEAVSFS